MSGGSDPRGFEVSEASSLRVLWILLPLVLAAGVGAWLMLDSNVPAGLEAMARWSEWSTWTGWPDTGLGAAWAVLFPIALGAVLAWAFHVRRVQLQDGVLTVRSTFFRCRTPVARMQLDQAAVVDLEHDRQHALRYRTLGYSLPGFHSGHYRLRGGGKGFVLITDMQRVLVIPVRDGPTLLLSLARPQTLLDALRRDALRRA